VLGLNKAAMGDWSADRPSPIDEQVTSTLLVAVLTFFRTFAWSLVVTTWCSLNHFMLDHVLLRRPGGRHGVFLVSDSSNVVSLFPSDAQKVSCLACRVEMADAIKAISAKPNEQRKALYNKLSEDLAAKKNVKDLLTLLEHCERGLLWWRRVQT
jgi:hypothetical protein